MTYFISLASIRGLSRDLRRCGSVNIALAFVASIEYLSPSSPSVSYEVTIGIDCEAAPCMAASQCALFESGRESRSEGHWAGVHTLLPHTDELYLLFVARAF